MQVATLHDVLRRAVAHSAAHISGHTEHPFFLHEDHPDYVQPKLFEELHAVLRSGSWFNVRDKYWITPSRFMATKKETDDGPLYDATYFAMLYVLIEYFFTGTVTKMVDSVNRYMPFKFSRSQPPLGALADMFCEICKFEDPKTNFTVLAEKQYDEASGWWSPFITNPSEDAEHPSVGEIVKLNRDDNSIAIIVKIQEHKKQDKTEKIVELLLLDGKEVSMNLDALPKREDDQTIQTFRAAMVAHCEQTGAGTDEERFAPVGKLNKLMVANQMVVKTRYFIRASTAPGLTKTQINDFLVPILERTMYQMSVIKRNSNTEDTLRLIESFEKLKMCDPEGANLFTKDDSKSITSWTFKAAQTYKENYGKINTYFPFNVEATADKVDASFLLAIARKHMTSQMLLSLTALAQPHERLKHLNGLLYGSKAVNLASLLENHFKNDCDACVSFKKVYYSGDDYEIKDVFLHDSEMVEDYKITEVDGPTITCPRLIMKSFNDLIKLFGKGDLDFVALPEQNSKTTLDGVYKVMYNSGNFNRDNAEINIEEKEFKESENTNRTGDQLNLDNPEEVQELRRLLGAEHMRLRQQCQMWVKQHSLDKGANPSHSTKGIKVVEMLNFMSATDVEQMKRTIFESVSEKLELDKSPATNEDFPDLKLSNPVPRDANARKLSKKDNTRVESQLRDALLQRTQSNKQIVESMVTDFLGYCPDINEYQPFMLSLQLENAPNKLNDFDLLIFTRTPESLRKEFAFLVKGNIENNNLQKKKWQATNRILANIQSSYPKTTKMRDILEPPGTPAEN